jgi:tetratricopeptide (TPR) repeat protein
MINIMPPFLKNSSVKAFSLFACLVLASFQLMACSSRQDRAQSYYDDAMGYLAKKDFGKARIELRNALQLDGKMLKAWRALAQVDERTKHLQDLVGALRRIVELDSKDVPSRIQLTKLYLLGGALNDALKMANAATDIAPQNASALALKSTVLFRLKDTDGAVKAAQKAIEFEPGNADARVILAATQLIQGHSDGALQTLAKVANARKDDLGVLLMKVNVYNRMGDLQQVEAILRKLIALHPDSPAFRSQLVRFYLAHNRQDDALKELRTAANANPADINTELALVNLLGNLKGSAAARAELVARINAGGHVFPYQIALAKLDFGQGHLADSVTLLQKLISGPNSPTDVLTAKNTLAEMYMQRNDIAAAEPLVSDILRADSRNTNGLRLRALIHLARNQYDDAIADLRSALNGEPRSPTLLGTLALAYERSGSIELADKAFLDATKASRFAPVYGLNYVEFLRRRGLNKQADNVLADLASRNPNSIAVLSALAKVKLAHHDWADAHEIAATIRRLGDKNNTADLINGIAFGGQNNFNDSVAALQKAYAANPRAVQPMAALVSAYIAAHHPKEAESFLQSALKANPDNAEALVLMGTIQLSNNDQKQAANYFREAIQHQPKAIVGYRALANLYAHQSKIDDAIKILKAGLQQQPKSFDLRLALAGLMEAKGQNEFAISEYRSMLKDYPGSMIVANNLASMLADHRTDKASLDEANSLTAMLTSSPVPQFKDTVGWVDYQRADYAAAIPLIEDAVAKLPNSALIRYHLGMAYLATGQDAKALEQFKKARALAPNDASLTTKIDTALKSHSNKNKE